MSEKSDSGTHQRNGNGNGKPSPNPPYNNTVVFFDFVSGGSDVTFPLLCQIWNQGRLIETVTVQGDNLSFNVPFYSGVSIIDSSSPAITLFRSGSNGGLPNLDIEIFSPDNNLISASAFAGGFSTPPTIDPSTIIDKITPVLNRNNSITLSITGMTLSTRLALEWVPFTLTITFGITPTTNMVDTTIVCDTPIVSPPPSLSLPFPYDFLEGRIIGDLTTKAITAINTAVNSMIFASVLTTINAKAKPPFSSWPPVTLTARLVHIGTSGILMGVTLGSFGSIADKLHISL